MTEHETERHSDIRNNEPTACDICGGDIEKVGPPECNHDIRNNELRAESEAEIRQQYEKLWGCTEIEPGEGYGDSQLNFGHDNFEEGWKRGAAHVSRAAERRVQELETEIGEMSDCTVENWALTKKLEIAERRVQELETVIKAARYAFEEGIPSKEAILELIYKVLNEREMKF